MDGGPFYEVRCGVLFQTLELQVTSEVPSW